MLISYFSGKDIMAVFRYNICKLVFRKTNSLLLFLAIFLFCSWCALSPLDELWIQENLYNRDDPFLINTIGCSIDNIDPLSDEILPFIKNATEIKCDGEIITYISKEENDVYLNINQTAAKNESLQCSFQGVDRDMTNSRPDNSVTFTSDLTTFTNRTQLTGNESVIRVVCDSGYENFHYIFRNEKQSTVYESSRPNVLLIGLDAMSRSSLLRTMPKTAEFVRQNGWINLKGYNKILHNTCPNLMAVTSGMEPSQSRCDDNTNQTWMDDKDFIWYHYKAHNYTTLYSEDFPTFSTFNYNKWGFLNEPTDYYLRAYYVAIKKLPGQDFCGLRQCFGPENIGPRMINFVKEYLQTVGNRSNSFGLFWMNSFSHSDLSCPTNMDSNVVELFQNFKDRGILDNTFVVFFSDHGFRFGRISETHAGWLENRLPFIFVSVPKSFRLEHREKYLNLIQNSERLTSPYDLHMTLHHILHLQDASYALKRPSGCQTCHSLFESISSERTCSDAGIPEFWCTCSKYVQGNKNDTMAERASEYVVQHVNELLNSTKCSQYSLSEILEVKFFKTSESKIKNIMLRVQMNPPAKFELNIAVQKINDTNEFRIEDVERLDRYAEISWCCDDKQLRKFCYCSLNSS